MPRLATRTCNANANIKSNVQVQSTSGVRVWGAAGVCVGARVRGVITPCVGLRECDTSALVKTNTNDTNVSVE